MKIHLRPEQETPSYDAQIKEWAATFDYAGIYGPPRRVGILATIDGKKVIYRALDGFSPHEMSQIYEFLESIGLIDFGIYKHPRFNCIYGLAADMPGQHDPLYIRCFE